MSGKRAKQLRKIAKSMTQGMPDVHYSEKGEQPKAVSTGYQVFMTPGTPRKLNTMSLKGYNKKLKKEKISVETIKMILGE